MRVFICFANKQNLIRTLYIDLQNYEKDQRGKIFNLCKNNPAVTALSYVYFKAPSLYPA